LLNLAVLLIVSLRRFFKHWYFISLDDQRRRAAENIQNSLQRLDKGWPVPMFSNRKALEQELLRRWLDAAPEERRKLTHLFRHWGLHVDRLTRIRHGPPWQQAESAVILGRIQVQEALPDLRRLLRGENRELRLAALRALELMGAPEAVDALVEILPGVKETAWRMVWAALISCARPEPERLLRHAFHPEPRVRMVIAATLGEVGTPPLLERLLPLADDPDPEVRAKAVWALGRSGSPRALPVLAERLRDPVWTVRLQSAGALGALGDRRAHEALALAVRDPHFEVRHKATGALYLLWRDPIALVDLLREGAPDQFALQSLISELEWRGITWEAINRVHSPLPYVREQSRALVSRLIWVGAYAPVLYALEMHPDTELRLVLLELVAKSLPPAGHLDFMELLGSPYLDARTRHAIEKVIGFPAEASDGRP